MAGASGLDFKELLQQDFAKSLVGQQDSFAYAVASKIQITEASVQRDDGNDGRVLSTTVVSECLLEKDMLSYANRAHGGCLAYLAEVGSTFAFKLHTHATGRGLSLGPTQSLNVVYHSPGFPDATLRIAATSLSIDNTHVSGKCEVWDVTSKRLVISAIVVKAILRSKL